MTDKGLDLKKLEANQSSLKHGENCIGLQTHRPKKLTFISVKESFHKPSKGDLKPSVIKTNKNVLLTNNQSLLNLSDNKGTTSTTSKLNMPRKIVSRKSDSQSAVQPKKLCSVKQLATTPTYLGLNFKQKALEDDGFQTSANCIDTRSRPTKNCSDKEFILDNENKFSQSHLNTEKTGSIRPTNEMAMERSENQSPLNSSEGMDTTDSSDKGNLQENQHLAYNSETKKINNESDKMKPIIGSPSITYNESKRIIIRHKNKPNSITYKAKDDGKTSHKVELSAPENSSCNNEMAKTNSVLKNSEIKDIVETINKDTGSSSYQRTENNSLILSSINQEKNNRSTNEKSLLGAPGGCGSSNVNDDFLQYRNKVEAFKRKITSPNFKAIKKADKELKKGNQFDLSGGLKQNETLGIGNIKSKEIGDPQIKLDSEKLSLKEIPTLNLPKQNIQEKSGPVEINSGGLKQNETLGIGNMKCKEIGDSQIKVNSEKLSLKEIPTLNLPKQTIQEKSGPVEIISGGLKQNETLGIGNMKCKEIGDSQIKVNSEKLSLKEIPTLNLPKQTIQEKSGPVENNSTITNNDVSLTNDNRKIEAYQKTMDMFKGLHKAEVRKFKKEIKELKRKIRRKDHVLSKLRKVKNESHHIRPNGKTNFKKDRLILEQILPRYVSKETFDIIISQIKKPDANPKSFGNRWVDEVKIFAMKIFQSSPKAYRILCSYLNLPSIKTLYKFIQERDLKASSDSNDKISLSIGIDDEENVIVPENLLVDTAANPKIKRSVIEMDHAYVAHPDMTTSVEELGIHAYVAHPDMTTSVEELGIDYFLPQPNVLISRGTEKRVEDQIMYFIASRSNNDEINSEDSTPVGDFNL